MFSGGGGLWGWGWAVGVGVGVGGCGGGDGWGCRAWGRLEGAVLRGAAALRLDRPRRPVHPCHVHAAAPVQLRVILFGHARVIRFQRGRPVLRAWCLPASGTSVRARRALVYAAMASLVVCVPHRAVAAACASHCPWRLHAAHVTAWNSPREVRVCVWCMLYPRGLSGRAATGPASTARWTS